IQTRAPCWIGFAFLHVVSCAAREPPVNDDRRSESMNRCTIRTLGLVCAMATGAGARCVHADCTASTPPTRLATAPSPTPAADGPALLGVSEGIAVTEDRNGWPGRLQVFRHATGGWALDRLVDVPMYPFGVAALGDTIAVTCAPPVNSTAPNQLYILKC